MAQYFKLVTLLHTCDKSNIGCELQGGGCNFKF